MARFLAKVICALALLGGHALPVQAQDAAAVLRDPRSPIARQPLSSEQEAELELMLFGVQKRPAYRALLANTPPLTLNDVLLSFSATFRRTQTAERLDVVRAGKALLLLWNGGREGWMLTSSLQLNEDCTPTLAYTLKDINMDGLREVAVQLACGDNVLGRNVLLLLDFSAVYPRALGLLPLEELYMSGAQQERHARIVEVYKGQPLRFVGEGLSFRGLDAVGQPQYEQTGQTEPLRLQASWPTVARPLW